MAGLAIKPPWAPGMDGPSRALRALARRSARSTSVDFLRPAIGDRFDLPPR
jgi:hypothetical protein